VSKALALQECYGSERAFSDPDPLVRIAAIHHAGARLADNDPLRRLLLERLEDPDELVVRYAAVTLAQAGERVGLESLLRGLRGADGALRQRLEDCVRNCTRFPFAVLLNELADLGSVADVPDADTRGFLQSALTLSGEQFYSRVREDGLSREKFLATLTAPDGLAGLRHRQPGLCELGLILGRPLGEQPGFLYCAARNLFFQFAEGAVLNPDYLQPGRQALFVALQGDRGGAARLLYVFEDRPPARGALGPVLGEGPASPAGLRVGVVAAIRRRKGEAQVEVLCREGRAYRNFADGGEGAVPLEQFASVRALEEEAATDGGSADIRPGQLALVEPEAAPGRPQCHVFVGQALPRAVAASLVRGYARRRGLLVARVVGPSLTTPEEGKWRVRVEDGSTVEVRLPAAAAGPCCWRSARAARGTASRPVQCARAAGRPPARGSTPVRSALGVGRRGRPSPGCTGAVTGSPPRRSARPAAGRARWPGAAAVGACPVPPATGSVRPGASPAAGREDWLSPILLTRPCAAASAAAAGPGPTAASAPAAAAGECFVIPGSARIAAAAATWWTRAGIATAGVSSSRSRPRCPAGLAAGPGGRRVPRATGRRAASAGRVTARAAGRAGIARAWAGSSAPPARARP
jgi:hypothetical protein